MFNRLSLSVLALIGFRALSVAAQAATPDETANCLLTLESNIMTQYALDPTDDTHFFNATWTYDPAFCTSRMVVTRARLINNVGGSTSTCTIQQFGPSGTLQSTCTRRSL